VWNAAVSGAHVDACAGGSRAFCGRRRSGGARRRLDAAMWVCLCCQRCHTSSARKFDAGGGRWCSSQGTAAVAARHLVHSWDLWWRDKKSMWVGRVG